MQNKTASGMNDGAAAARKAASTALCLCAFLLSSTPACRASDWPQYQRDAQRTGYSPDQIDGPYKLVWARNFVPGDRLHPAAQMVVAEGKCYIGTKGGWFYALDPATGAELWKFKAGGGVQHTAGVENGLVFFGALDGCVYALATKDGTLAWKFTSPGEILNPGFSCAVCLAEGKIFIPRRDGVVFALDQKTGAELWRRDTGTFTRAGASYWEEKLYICTEDMRMRCLSAKDGSEIWVTEQVYGGSWGDFCPVIINGKVLANVMRTVPGMGTVPMPEANGLTGPVQHLNGKPVRWWDAGRGDSHGLMEVNTPDAAELRMRLAAACAEGRMPEELTKYNLFDDGLEYFKANPQMVTLQVRDAKTGKQHVVAHRRIPMMGGPPSPPVRWKDGTIVTGMALGNTVFCRVDLETGHVVDLLLNVLTPQELEKGKNDPTSLRELFHAGGGNGDETVNLSIGGDMIYAIHTHDLAGTGNCVPTGAYSDGVFDMRSRRWFGRRLNPLHLGTYAPQHDWSDRPVLHGDPALHIMDEHRSGGGSPAVISAPYWYHVSMESTIIARTAR